MYTAFFYLSFLAQEIAIAKHLDYKIQPLFAGMLSTLLILYAYSMKRSNWVTAFNAVIFLSMVNTFIMLRVQKSLAGDSLIVFQGVYNTFSTLFMIMDIMIMAGMIYGNSQRINFNGIGQRFRYWISVFSHSVRFENNEAKQWPQRSPAKHSRQAGSR